MILIIMKLSTILILIQLKLILIIFLKKNTLVIKNYFKTGKCCKNKDDGLFSFETKRNLVTNSAEFYDLSYEYLNDCLKAGLVYRKRILLTIKLKKKNFTNK